MAHPQVVNDWRQTEFLRLQDAARILGISVATIYSRAHRGELTLHRMFGRAVLRTKDVCALVDAAPAWQSAPRTRAASEAQRRRAAEREI